tara:strand:+ start:405 stop:695 length:291 start_codon:yes stop_codon:yes gene_type:complete
VIVKLNIDLAKGFKPWKKMFFENEHRLLEHGGKLMFAGTEKDNDNKLIVIMKFDTPEGLNNFATDEDLKKTRAEAGAKLESTVVTLMNPESFNNTN